MSKQSWIQVQRKIWIVMICLSGAISSGQSQNSEILSETPETEATIHPSGIDTGGKLQDTHVTGKLLQFFCLHLLALGW